MVIKKQKKIKQVQEKITAKTLEEAINKVKDNKIPKAAVLPKSDKAKIKKPANKMMLV